MWLGMCWRAPKHPSNTAECQQAIDCVSYLSDCGGANLGKRIEPLDCAGSQLVGVAIGMLVLAVRRAVLAIRHGARPRVPVLEAAAARSPLAEIDKAWTAHAKAVPWLACDRIAQARCAF